MKDSRGIKINHEDAVIVARAGDELRLTDVGVQSPVLALSSRRKQVLMQVNDRELWVGAWCLAVAGRDGRPGYEADREPTIGSDPKRVARLMKSAFVSTATATKYVLMAKEAGPADGLEAARQLLPGSAFSHFKWGHPVYVKEEKR